MLHDAASLSCCDVLMKILSSNDCLQHAGCYKTSLQTTVKVTAVDCYSTPGCLVLALFPCPFWRKVVLLFGLVVNVNSKIFVQFNS